MIRRFRTGAAGIALLAPGLLSACAPAAQPVLAPAAKSAPVFTLDTPVDRIAADPQGKAVLYRDIPGVMNDRRYPLFDDMSLSEIAAMSHGRLTQSQLDLVKSDLTQLSELTPEPAGQTANNSAQ